MAKGGIENQCSALEEQPGCHCVASTEDGIPMGAEHLTQMVILLERIAGDELENGEQSLLERICSLQEQNNMLLSCVVNYGMVFATRREYYGIGEEGERFLNSADEQGKGSDDDFWELFSRITNVLSAVDFTIQGINFLSNNALKDWAKIKIVDPYTAPAIKNMGGFFMKSAKGFGNDIANVAKIYGPQIWSAAKTAGTSITNAGTALGPISKILMKSGPFFLAGLASWGMYKLAKYENSLLPDPIRMTQETEDEMAARAKRMNEGEATAEDFRSLHGDTAWARRLYLGYLEANGDDRLAEELAIADNTHSFSQAKALQIGKGLTLPEADGTLNANRQDKVETQEESRIYDSIQTEPNSISGECPSAWQKNSFLKMPTGWESLSFSIPEQMKNIYSNVTVQVSENDFIIREDADIDRVATEIARKLKEVQMVS